MTIRTEQPTDYPAVYNLVREAFVGVSYADGTESEYLNLIRKKQTFVPELSLVAEQDGQIIGQIVLYETCITTASGLVTALVLSPISVHPHHRRRGVARALVEQDLKRALGMGYPAVFLCGEPELYRRLGFRPSHELDIHHISDTAQAANWCMVRELTLGALDGIAGTVEIV